MIPRGHAAVVVLVAGLLSSPTFAQQPPAELKDASTAITMLSKVAEGMQRDIAATIADIRASTGEFRQGDIYPFCYIAASGELETGQNPGSLMQSLKTGDDNWGKRLFDGVAAHPGLHTFEYKAPKPGGNRNQTFEKVSFALQIPNTTPAQVCGVGYYR